MPIRFQVIDLQTNVLLTFTWTISSRKEMQFHLPRTCGEPDELEMRQGLWGLFFLQTNQMAVKGAHGLLCARRNQKGSMLKSRFCHVWYAFLYNDMVL